MEIVEEQAKIVRRIYDLYLSGYGLKAIAGILNSEGIKSQGYYQKTVLGKNIGSNKPEIFCHFLQYYKNRDFDLNCHRLCFLARLFFYSPM